MQLYKLFFSVLSFLLATLEGEATREAGAPRVLPKEAHTLAQHAPEIAAIKTRGILRVAMHQVDHPPFFMKDEKGELIGLDVEIAKDIAAQLQVKLEIIRTAPSFDDVVQQIIDGEADVAIAKLSMTLPRAEKVRYTSPYVTMSKALLINRFVLGTMPERITVREMFDLPQAKIGAIAHSSYANLAVRVFPKAQVFPEPSWDKDLVPRLKRGELWALFRDELEVRRTMFLVKDAALNFLAVNLSDEQDPIMMAVHRNHVLLQQWLNLYIEYAFRKPEMSEVIKKYEKYLREESIY
jgi:ABC-type amino acid transport substrate-binding protein